MASTDPSDFKKIAPESGQSALKTYALVAAGSDSILNLLRHESILFLCCGLYGALGIVLRRVLYRYIFAELGKNVTIGRNVTVRGAGKIHIGDNVMIDDGCVLDARGEGTRIVIGDNTLLSGQTVVRARNGLITMGKGCSIGRNCLLGTDKRIVIGDEVLLGAYAYLCAGGVHRFEGPEDSIISQGIEESQGIEIGSGAWLGARVTVLDGADVGRGAVVGAHALVTRTLPDRVIAFGNPARVQRGR